MKTVVYKLTREDGQIYIGITINFRKRLTEHKNSKRFKEFGIKEYTILEECETYNEAEILEEKYIKKFDSFHNGLNNSINGKGNHLSKKFTTKGFKFSEESKRKMRENHWSRNGGIPWQNKIEGPIFSEESIKKMSNTRKGYAWSPVIITEDIAADCLKIYQNDSVEFSDEFVKKFVKKSQKEKVGKIPFEDLKSQNGKPITKYLLYKHYFGEIYGTTPNAFAKILKGFPRAPTHDKRK